MRKFGWIENFHLLCINVISDRKKIKKTSGNLRFTKKEKFWSQGFNFLKWGWVVNVSTYLEQLMCFHVPWENQFSGQWQFGWDMYCLIQVQLLCYVASLKMTIGSFFMKKIHDSFGSSTIITILIIHNTLTSSLYFQWLHHV